MNAPHPSLELYDSEIVALASQALTHLRPTSTPTPTPSPSLPPSPSLSPRTLHHTLPPCGTVQQQKPAWTTVSRQFPPAVERLPRVPVCDGLQQQAKMRPPTLEMPAIAGLQRTVPQFWQWEKMGVGMLDEKTKLEMFLDGGFSGSWQPPHTWSLPPSPPLTPPLEPSSDVFYPAHYRATPSTSSRSSRSSTASHSKRAKRQRRRDSASQPVSDALTKRYVEGQTDTVRFRDDPMLACFWLPILLLVSLYTIYISYDFYLEPFFLGIVDTLYPLVRTLRT